MRIGVPKEIKNHEYRVGLTPEAVRELTKDGHSVLVETVAGSGAGFADEEYEAAGARVAPSADKVFCESDLIVKVKEPQLEECQRLSADQVLFTFLHLAADREQAIALMDSRATAIAYETVTARDGSLPLLAPMSRVAGRMSIQAGAHVLEKPSGGAGILLGGVPGVRAAKVVVLGAGVSGQSAVEVAVGMQADVTVIDLAMPKLEEISERYGNRVQTEFSTTGAIEKHVADADLVIGCVLIPGAAAPKLVTRDMIASMRPGSVVVDISIDQGGCFETSRPTSHSEPTFVEEGVVHYCVTNMPGAVPRTSAMALNNATLPYVRALAAQGWQSAFHTDPGFRDGLNVHAGFIYNKRVADALNLEYRAKLVAA
ncbi:MAG TPA: alanine dehydrogenase [Gammaproteobacteria bacterium]